MYGMINKSIEALITSRYGQTVWEQILDEAGIGRPDYVLMRSYDDDETYKIVGAATKILNVSAEEVLEAFGEYWVGYAEIGYGELLRFTGDNFLEFVSHLDEMHARIKLAFPELRPPSFTTTPLPGGAMEIHYRSERAGLQPVVRGVLNGLAKRMGITLAIVQSEDPADGHAIFHVTPSGPGRWTP
ncbi:MAG: heme NO-binding domain-containing protein [Armatimonadota bacterium]